MEIDYTGKTIIITGAGGGIGSESAKLFAKLGGNVVLSDIDDYSLQDISHAISQSGGEFTTVVADLTNPDQVENVITVAVKKIRHCRCIV